MNVSKHFKKLNSPTHVFYVAAAARIGTLLEIAIAYGFSTRDTLDRAGDITQ